MKKVKIIFLILISIGCNTIEKNAALNDLEHLDQRLLVIKENVKKINNIKEWTTIIKKELGKSPKNGTATYYYMADNLLKIVSIHFEERGKFIQKFYTMNDELSFILDKSGELVDSNYFEKGILIKQINNQDCGAPFAEDYLKKEAVRLQTEYKNLVNSRKTTQKIEQRKYK